MQRYRNQINAIFLVGWAKQCEVSQPVSLAVLLVGLSVKADCWTARDGPAPARLGCLRSIDRAGRTGAGEGRNLVPTRPGIQYNLQTNHQED